MNLKKRGRIMRSRGGFTIMEIMVAVGILSFVTLASVSLLNMILASTSKAKFENDITNDLFRIRTLLGKPEVCLANLEGKKVISEFGKEFSLKEVSKDKDKKWVLSKNPLSDLNAVARLKLDKEGLALLSLQYRAKAAIVGPQEIARDIVLRVELDKKNKVVGCAPESVSEGTPDFEDYFEAKGLPNFPRAIICSKSPKTKPKSTHILRLYNIDQMDNKVAYMNPWTYDRLTNYVLYDATTGAFVSYFPNDFYFDPETCPQKLVFDGAEVQWKK